MPSSAHHKYHIQRTLDSTVIQSLLSHCRAGACCGRVRGESSAMDGVVGPIKAYLKKRDPATIDNFAFKLHYRVTFVVMLVCMMLVTARYIVSTYLRLYLHISTTTSTTISTQAVYRRPDQLYRGRSAGRHTGPLLLDTLHLQRARQVTPSNSLQIFLCIFTNIFVRLRISV